MNLWLLEGEFGESNSTPLQYSQPGKSHGLRSLEGCSPWGHQESDTTERLRFHFSLSCIGEGNGNPLQCSCLENPRDEGAWWTAVFGVAQSRTQLTRLTSSRSSSRRGVGGKDNYGVGDFHAYTNMFIIIFFSFQIAFFFFLNFT